MTTFFPNIKSQWLIQLLYNILFNLEISALQSIFKLGFLQNYRSPHLYTEVALVNNVTPFACSILQQCRQIANSFNGFLTLLGGTRTRCCVGSHNGS